MTLFAMLVAAKVMAEVFERLRQPAVAGEILAGVKSVGKFAAIRGPSNPALREPHNLCRRPDDCVQGVSQC